jgi:glycosyltransferase involved in cell wall biosynthesis
MTLEKFQTLPNLTLCVPRGWDSYISCEFNEIHEQLSKLGWNRIIIDDYTDEEILKKIRISTSIILWEAYEFIERNEGKLKFISEVENPLSKKFFFCDDVHYYSEHRKNQRLRGFHWSNKILSTYPRKLKEWYSEVDPTKIIWTPHSAASFFKPSFQPKDIRVLLSGSRGWAYPFRQFCHEKLPLTLCQTVDHPGYPGYPGDLSNKSRVDLEKIKLFGRTEYVNVLRKYPAMVCCGSVFDYLVAKVFEAMASGCLVICEKKSLATDLAKLGFLEGIHYIGTDYFNLIQDVESALHRFTNDRNAWQRIVDNAHDKIQNEHTTAIRASEIHKICTEER